MAKIDAEATRLGKDVNRGSRDHYKSIVFLCKGALWIPRTKKGRLRRIDGITRAAAIKIIGFKTGGSTFK
jgi:hypothetical protein